MRGLACIHMYMHACIRRYPHDCSYFLAFLNTCVIDTPLQATQQRPPERTAFTNIFLLSIYHAPNINVYISTHRFNANRVFSTLIYTPLPSDKTKATNMDCSANDLKSWLKVSLLNCITSMLEGCATGDEAYPIQFLEFFELKNLVSQMVASARLIGLVDPGERTTDVMVVGECVCVSE